MLDYHYVQVSISHITSVINLNIRSKEASAIRMRLCERGQSHRHDILEIWLVVKRAIKVSDVFIVYEGLPHR